MVEASKKANNFKMPGQEKTMLMMDTADISVWFKWNNGMKKRENLSRVVQLDEALEECD